MEFIKIDFIESIDFIECIEPLTLLTFIDFIIEFSSLTHGGFAKVTKFPTRAPVRKENMKKLRYVPKGT